VGEARTDHPVTSIDAVILDVDGTLATCPYDFDAMRAAVAQAAAQWRFDVSALGIRGVIEQIEAVASALGDEGDTFRQRAEREVSAIEIAAARTATLLPGAADALTCLRRAHLGVGLITRNCRAATSIVLQGFDGYDALLTRDEVPRPKPDPDHVLRCLAALHRSADQAGLIGDHFFDMQAGRAAGLKLCIGVRTGTSSDSSLVQAGADAVIDSVADLPDYLWAFEGATR
jgi:phosphoglycolate phosphatase